MAGKKRGRPRKELTEDQWAIVDEWARNLMRAEDIAAFLGVDKTTLYAPHNRDRFRRSMAMKGAATRLELRTAQLALARDPKAHPAHLIFALKNHDGQTDRTAITGGDGGPLELTVQSFQAFEELMGAAKKKKAAK